MFQKTNWSLYLAAALLPMVALITWLVHNTQLPTADAVAMFLNSFNVYRHAMDGHLGEFFKGIYNARDWRPTAYYVFLIPIQFLTGGDMMRTAQGIEIISRLVTLYYILRLLMLALPVRSAAFATALLGLLPAVQWPAGYFGFSEGIFMPAMFAGIYYLILSDSLQSRRFAVYFVIAATISFITRPVESLSHMGPVFAVFFFMAWRRGLFSLRQLYALTLLGGIFFSALLIKGWITGFAIRPNIFALAARGKLYARIGRVLLGLTAALILMGIGQQVYARRYAISQTLKGWAKPPYIVHAFVAVVFFTVAFFIGHVPGLVEWLYSTSVGELAEQIEGQTLREKIKLYYGCAGMIPFTLIAVLGALSFFFCINAEQRKNLLKHPLLLLLAVIPFTLFLVLGSKQYFSRKVTLMVLAFLLVCLVPALMQGRLWRMRVAVLAALGLAQFGGLMHIGLGGEHTDQLSKLIGTTLAYPRMVMTDPNPHSSYYELMRDNAKKPGIWHVLTPMTYPADPFLLGAISSMRGGVTSAYPFLEGYDDTSIPTILKNRGAQAIVINNDIDAPFTHTPEEAARFDAAFKKSFAPNDKMKYVLLRDFSLGVLESKYGLEKLECRVLPASTLEACIFKIKQ